MNWYPYVVAALFGLMAGSFLNVVVYRLPLGRSVVRPRSACPACGRPIAWHENVPVLGWLALRGRCRGCGGAISPRYPVVELLGGVLAVLCLRRYGAGVDAVFAYAFLMALLAVTLIDWEHRIIPDEISLPFILVGVAWSAVSPSIDLLDSALGVVVGGGGLWLVGVLYRLVRHAEGMGGGDIKLMAMIGAFLGVRMVVPVILIASFFGSIYGVALMRRTGAGGSAKVAFGSFLAPAAGCCLFLGSRILAWYLGRL
ncbi:MAG: prepilin peptidase [Candidatus Krumholzibacteriota bacterium]|nr:prepilin peptidase [Candidatus Krumholzibacteriota bacterium]